MPKPISPTSKPNKPINHNAAVSALLVRGNAGWLPAGGAAGLVVGCGITVALGIGVTRGCSGVGDGLGVGLGRLCSGVAVAVIPGTEIIGVTVGSIVGSIVGS